MSLNEKSVTHINNCINSHCNSNFAAWLDKNINKAFQFNFLNEISYINTVDIIANKNNKYLILT